MSDTDLPQTDGAPDPIADAAMTSMDDAAGGPQAEKDEPGEEEAAAQLGDFA